MADTNGHVLHATDHLTDTDGDWMGKTAAAKRLGCSERTVDRKLSQGKYKKRLTSDGQVEVFLPRATTPPDEMADNERQLALVERYQEAVARQTIPLLQTIERQGETIREQAEELGKLRAKLEMLEQPKLPWWRRLFQ